MPYGDRAVWPDRDTVNVFQVFYTFYNNWFWHGEFTRWFPYANCGMQADYWQWFNLTPAAYLAGVLGRVLRIQDVLGLFKFSILLEQVMMLYGMFRLCGRLYRHEAARFFACLVLMGSTVWLLQVYWNFRIFYLLPLVMDGLLGWLEESRWRDLGQAGLAGVFSLVGNVAYFGVLYAGVLMLFVGLAAWRAKPDWRGLRPRWRDMAWLLVVLGVAGLYVYGAAHMLDHIHGCSPGRESGMGAVTLKQFLEDGSGAGLWKFRELGFPLKGLDFTLYMGSLSVVFAGYALLRVRGGYFAAFWIPALCVALLSTGDALPVAAWIYRWFPPMRWFHYIGQLGGFLRMPLAVCAGYGLDQWLTDRGGEATGKGAHRWIVLAGTGLVLVLGVWCYGMYRPLLVAPWSRIYPVEWGLLAAGGLGLGLLPQRAWRASGWLAVMVVALDLGVFQGHILQGWPCRWKGLDPAAGRVRWPEYSAERSAVPPEGTVARAAQEAVERHPTQRCSVEAGQFMQWDSGWCRRYHNLFWAEGLNELLKATGNLRTHWEGLTLNYWVRPEAVESAALGWAGQGAKLRLVAKAVHVADAAAAERWLKVTESGRIPVLETPAVEGEDGPGAGEGELPLPEVVVFTGNGLEARVRVGPRGGAWLYYADSYHPGWKAYVDGERVPVVRANLAFKAIRVPAGEHRVRWAYWGGVQGWVCLALAVAALAYAAGMLFYGIPRAVMGSGGDGSGRGG